MKQFADLVTRLDQTTKTNEKIEALADYLHAAPDADKLWMMALFSGRRPRRALKSSQLREWAAERSGIPLWLLEESYHVVGDLAETIALLLPAPGPEALQRSLSEWMAELAALSALSDDDRKSRLLAAWEGMTARERFVFNKLITGGFRLGVSQQLMVKALARYSGIEEQTLSHRLMGDWKPDTSSFRNLIFDESAGDNLSRPYPFYLAYALDAAPESLGSPGEWQAEWKWDGIRAQLIVREGNTYLWSRGEELMTDKFPELNALLQHLPTGTVIDGELLPFRDEKPLSFQVLQTRIGRKSLTRKILQEAPVIVMAYDLLEWEGKDLRALPFATRRALLAEAVQLAARPDLLRLSPPADFGTWEELAELRLRAREIRSEGLMLKRLDSVYQAGRRRGDWWKWKLDALSVDAVMIYAQRGHGRRANLYSDYTFAVWDGDVLVPFTKAYSGLTDAEMSEIDAWIKQNTLDRFGPVRSVKPERVFEIGFEGIAASGRHKSGVALRFPRMLRLRNDKSAAEADTLASLKALLDRA
ncbi:MAG: ATP-dependent DNA ligase [Bacteroidetes bacterium]|nr:MAG: ATP-dependent DNA ligase [Bacteroidota bacterium]